MKIIAIVLFLLAIYSVYKMVKAYKSKDRKNYFRLMALAVACIFISAGFWMSSPQYKQAAREASESSSRSAASKSSSESEAESIEKARNKMKKNGLKQLNKKIAAEPELAGLKIKRDKDVGDDDYTVTVPDEVASYTDNEQKETYRHLVSIIKQYTGDDNPTVMFVDSTGSTIAETRWNGQIKLDD